MNTSLNNEAARRLTLDSCYNVRDVGGYATEDGRVTRWRALLRSDSLHRLTSASQEALIAYPIRTIVDLRRAREVQENPYEFSQVDQITRLHMSLQDEEGRAEELHDLGAYYRFILDNCQGQLYAIFKTLSDTQAFPVLVHCAVGKDRTGLIVALLLGLVNVPAATIAEDYALSGDYLAPLFEELRLKAVEAGRDLARFEPLLQAQAETMLQTLEYLDTKYGGVKNYLSQIGLTPAQLDYLATSMAE